MDSGAADEPVPGRDEVKGVGGDRGDASVVTDDPGQGRPGQSCPLPCAEDAWILVPQPGYFRGGRKVVSWGNDVVSRVFLKILI